MTVQDMKETILKTAATMIRSRGYNGFSFREIADAVGVKSASVHYHFPTKEALGAAVARRYTEDFLTALGPVDEAPLEVEAVQARLHGQARRSLVEENLMCLCGMLGAEVADLPYDVVAETRRFFERSVAWAEAALARTTWGQGVDAFARRRLALSTLAASEGALILARSLGDMGVFDQVDLPRPG